MVDAVSWSRVLTIIAHSRQPIVIVSATAHTTRHLAEAAQRAATDLDSALKIGEEINKRHQGIITQFLTTYSGKLKVETKQECLEWIQECSTNLAELLKIINTDGAVSPQNNDAVLSMGEQLSARLFALCGRVFGLNTIWVDACSIIKTDSNYGKARPDLKKIDENIHQLEFAINQNITPVIGGFYGENDAGQITTLGFEGSDYSASLIGASLNADAIEIWTDVSGIFTCDPRIIPTARPIKTLSFNDAEQLANHGAKVLHPASIQPAAAKNIPVLVKNIFQSQDKGTTINTFAEKNDFCKAITFIKDVPVLKINTTNQRLRDRRLIEVFSIFDDYESAILALKTEKKSTIVILNDYEQANRLKRELSKITTIREIENRSLIGMIGCAGTGSTLTERIKNILGQMPIQLFHNDETGVLSLLVDDDKLLDTVKTLHQDIFNLSSR